MALVQGQILNDEDSKKNNTNKRLREESTEDEDDFSDRSYGFKEPVSKTRMPTASSKLVSKQSREPGAEDFGEPENIEDIHDPEKMDSSERLQAPDGLDDPDKSNDDFEQVKKVKEVSVISLVPKNRNKVLDPISEQQAMKTRIVRPGRDLSIIIRNRHHPVLIARHVPVHWIPHHPHQHHHPHPHHPPSKPVYPPSMPKHKPCKPCKPKVHKKHHHKPKKPKKKPKKEHCHPHHKPKKPNHKKLIYYAPMPTAMNNFYRNRLPAKMFAPYHSYDVNESQENADGDVEAETEKPFSQQIEDDVEDHRLAEITEPFEEDDPVEESNLK